MLRKLAICALHTLSDVEFGILFTSEDSVKRISGSILILLLITALYACDAATLPGSGEGGAGKHVTPGKGDTPTPVPTPEKIDFSLSKEDNGTTIRMKNGQSFAVMLGMDTAFELRYDPDFLRLDLPKEDPNHPGTGGWVFTAIKNGTTQLEIVSKPPSSDRDVGAPSFVYQITLVIEDQELTLSREDNGTTIQVAQGKTFAIQLDMDVAFELDYDDDYLELISPKEDPSRPGAGGWIFKTLRIGTTVVEIKSMSPSAEESGAPSLIYHVTIEINE